MSIFDIDGDIRRARTLGSDFYLDRGYFEASRERIFARSWQFAGHQSEVTGLRPLSLLPGYLDEPLLITRSGDDFKCLSNVCTHRGKVLVEEPCEANLIRCGYHGRRFSLDGKVLSMPEFEGVEDFPSSDDDLKQVHLDRSYGFLFASLDPVDTLAGYLGTPNDLKLPMDYLELRASKEYTVNAHWALYCENYLEGFHIPYVHRSLNEIVDYGTYETETFRYASVQTGFDAEGNIAARYLFVFPNTMLNFYPWGVSVNVVRPLAPDLSVVEFLTYVSEEGLMDSGAGADLHSVEMEDEAVVESVQRGIRSKFYDRGRYSPTREQGTHHFHRTIAEFMN